MLVLGIFSLMTAVALPNVNISPILLTRVASIVILYAAALSFNALDIQAIGSGVSIYSGLFQVTTVSQSISFLIFLLGAVILLPWAPGLRKFHPTRKTLNTALPSIAEYPLIILFSTCGARFLVSSVDLVSVYLSIELQSFAVYILATLYRDSESATSAGLKYFLLGGLSSGLILLGSALIYASTGLTNLESIFSLVSVTSRESVNSLPRSLLVSPNPSAIGLTILVVGFLFKVSAAPFHNWAPDVYDGVPTIVTTWLAIMPKISIFVLILEIQSGLGLSGPRLSFIIANTSNRVDVGLFDVWKNLLLASSLFSLIIGTVVGLAQHRIKRLLAYSTISHVGFLLLALAIHSEQSIRSFIFYLIQYSVTNLNRFLIILAFGYVIHKGKNGKNTDVQFISELAGQFRANPLLGLALTICLFSIRGVPPLIGFFGKQIVLYSATHRGYYFLSIVAIVVSVISASYYLKIVRVIHFLPLDQESSENMKWNTFTKNQLLVSEKLDLTDVHSFAIATLTLAITLFVLDPSIILNSTSLLALTLFSS